MERLITRRDEPATTESLSSPRTIRSISRHRVASAPPNLSSRYLCTDLVGVGEAFKGSDFTNMKELRVQHDGDPYRLLFAFDPSRQAVVLIGGNKRGDKRWYDVNIPIADRRFREYLEETSGGEFL